MTEDHGEQAGKHDLSDAIAELSAKFRSEADGSQQELARRTTSLADAAVQLFLAGDPDGVERELRQAVRLERAGASAILAAEHLADQVVAGVSEPEEMIALPHKVLASCPEMDARHFEAVMDMLNARLAHQALVWMRADGAHQVSVQAAEASQAGLAHRARIVMQSSDEASLAVLWLLVACAATYADQESD